MQDFNATLVREKLTINDQKRAAETGAVAFDVRSNRLMLSFSDRVIDETLVIRAQNMHMTLRIGARLFYSFHKNGLFTRRSEPYDWAAMWDMVMTAHDRKHIPNSWAAIYLNGKPVFRTVDAPFIDVVEKCATRDAENYDKAIVAAESMLSEAGEFLKLQQLSKVGAIFHDDGKSLRCGIIHRADGRDTTFNFTATKGELFSRVPQGFNIAAAYLEAFDIRHYMRYTFKQIQKGTVAKHAPELGRYYAAPQRLRDLRKALQSFEEHFDVRYRPEKPDVFSPPKDVVV